MTFAREKRLLLGAVALLAPLPLPLTDALEWLVLGAYLVAVAAFLRRAYLGAERWLGNRALNLLGLAYLPLMVVDFASIGQTQVVRPILHLTLFGVAAKLWSLSRERDKWQAWIGIFFVFLAAMATSVHPSVLLVPDRLPRPDRRSAGALRLPARPVELRASGDRGAGAAARPVRRRRRSRRRC